MDSNGCVQLEVIVYYLKKMRWSMLNIVYGESALHNNKPITNGSK